MNHISISNTLTTKFQWRIIAEGEKGIPYGHVPGHHYHDVFVTISKRGEKSRVEVVEVWGSAQGHDDEEYGRNRVVAIDTSLANAIRIANLRAKEAGIREDYLIQALSSAHADVVDRLSDDIS